MFEFEFIPIVCGLILGGAWEQTEAYGIHAGDHRIRADCVTETHAVEIGLDDRRSSYDSVHQAIFAAHLTGREPMVVIIDTNGIEDAAEYQVETVARLAGVEYRVYDRDYLLRVQMTEPFRSRLRLSHPVTPAASH
ncbi:hypothetical protein HKCCE2091_09560 [Rhodobacterales bacterium HKCCE2091]|nr:hypothetical protein [Rhodobacterales bacterium HKCCE2091]